MTMLIEFRGDCFVRPGEWCKLDLKTDEPIRLFGQIGETAAEAAIAPRIDSEPERVE